jgi:hypothetical protein
MKATTITPLTLALLIAGSLFFDTSFASASEVTGSLSTSNPAPQESSRSETQGTLGSGTNASASQSNAGSPSITGSVTGGTAPTEYRVPNSGAVLGANVSDGGGPSLTDENGTPENLALSTGDMTDGSNAYTAAQDAGILGSWTLWAFIGIAVFASLGMYLYGRRIA